MPENISINQIIEVLLKRIWVIVIISILGFGIAFFLSKFVIAKQYTATEKLYVYNPVVNQNFARSSIDLTYTRALVDTYIIILKSEPVLKSVAEKVNLGYTAGQIGAMIDASAINQTEIFQVSVTNKNPKDALAVAQAIAEVAPLEIMRVVKAGAVEIVSEPNEPKSPSAPNVSTNSLIGLFLGVVVSVLMVFGLEFLNTAVKDEEDLTNRYEFPVLGSIPNLEEV